MMKVICSSETCSAATMRSPSFSRSALSTTMIMRPSLRAGSAWGMGENGIDSHEYGITVYRIFGFPMQNGYFPATARKEDHRVFQELERIHEDLGVLEIIDIPVVPPQQFGADEQPLGDELAEAIWLRAPDPVAVVREVVLRRGARVGVHDVEEPIGRESLAGEQCIHDGFQRERMDRRGS